ncbi:zinc ribbon domain-containing protein [Litorilinea aerophila]|uniref:Zinc ribbon domain-containing protein n=1 Tax=Litorilinea aerophila TaxID=1204385 RepID=A0A540VJE7_9CHLR|nr:zinc ribbon domain-containing protein [Litorilinea aerophila]MCC9076137.1 zinc ribbon domain-containing protein [Litorilinea aerophila]OUC06634.1 hypothetical protein RY27_19835 [Litorilinea aerophila]GIV78836.1 MAG: hypothetical protein KatS3mg050_3230 [Litorilinea sp.]
MPMYEFICQECQQPFEKLLSMSRADEPQVCPTCGSKQTQRRLSTFAVGGGSTGRTATPPRTSPFT